MKAVTSKVIQTNFKFSGKVARILGRESIADKVTALSELIKNAYDADATKIKIEMHDLDDPESSHIIIRDDGAGLSVEEFLQKWMIVGTESKEIEPYSPKGRRRIGEKGVGRFSVERLSHQVIIRSEKQGKKEGLEVAINWDDFEKKDTFFDLVSIKLIQLELSETSSGFFEVELRRLRDKWIEKDIEEIVRDVSFLISPEADKDDFRIELEVPKYPGITKRVTPKVFDLAYYVLQAELRENGDVHLQVKFRDGAQEEIVQSLGPIVCGPMKLKTYFYRLGGRKYFRVSYPGLGLERVKKALDLHSNIRIYRDGMWVKPYGIPGEDWLGLDEARLYRLAEMPSSRQVIGFLKIFRDKNPLLSDTTSREGLARGPAFDQMKEFILVSLSWAMRHWQKKLKEIKKEMEKIEEADPEKIIKNVEKMIRNLPPKYAEPVSKNIQELKFAVREKVEIAEKAEALFKIQASLGISLASIMHETAPRITQAMTEFEKIKMEIVAEPPRIPRIIKNTETGNEALETIKKYMNYGLGTQQYDVGKIKKCNLSERLRFAISAFENLFSIYGISIDLDIPSDLPEIRLRVIELDSIFMNLISNSYSVLREIGGDKKIVVKAEAKDNEFIITFWDSGTGIPLDKRELVFMEGFTTKRGGTGLGLKIIRDIVESNNGTFLIEDDERGGSNFKIRLPFKGEEYE